ncbi:MAG TPA: hypothetical protein VFE63_17285 [Roseiarcus sp.]|nr:hypothetical protein [Roseiarcus sp.]
MTTKPNEEPDAIEALLPWYAAGTLDGSSRRRVEEALASRPELRESLRRIEEDRQTTIALNEGLGAPRPEVLQRIMAAAEAAPRRPTLASRLGALTSVFLAGGAPPLAWAAVAAAIVILVESAAIVALFGSHARETYETASAKPKVGVEALVAFAPDARMDQIDAFLKERGASIEDGPRGGMYRIRFGEKRLSEQETRALLQSLGASPVVRSALPAGEE